MVYYAEPCKCRMYSHRRSKLLAQFMIFLCDHHCLQFYGSSLIVALEPSGGPVCWRFCFTAPSRRLPQSIPFCQMILTVWREGECARQLWHQNSVLCRHRALCENSATTLCNEQLQWHNLCFMHSLASRRCLRPGFPPAMGCGGSCALSSNFCSRYQSERCALRSP